MLLQFIEYHAPPRSTAPDQAIPKAPLQFTDLPLELRELIWEFSLCTERVFHVRALRPDPVSAGGASRVSGYLEFHNPHPPPPATALCAESRRVAWRTGCVLLQPPPARGLPAVWLNPASDVLYFDRNLRGVFNQLAEPAEPGTRPAPRISVPGLDRVRHAAFEWRWFTQDGSRPLAEYSSPAMRAFWAAKTDRLCAYLPGLRALHYVLPLVRHQGGVPWGREPSVVRGLPIALVDLPAQSVVPIESGFPRWEDVRAELERTLGDEWQRADKRAKFGGALAKFPPAIIGDRLLRIGAPTTFEHSTIRVFDW